jgi:hypothetical protein
MKSNTRICFGWQAENERERELDTGWAVFKAPVGWWLVGGLYYQYITIYYLCIGDRDYHNPFDDQIHGMRLQRQGHYPWL